MIESKSCSVSARLRARICTSPVAVRTCPEDRFTELARMAFATSLKLRP
jgi:hypothetical protein